MTGERLGETFGEAMERIKAEAEKLTRHRSMFVRLRTRRILASQRALRVRMDERQDTILREHFN